MSTAPEFSVPDKARRRSSSCHRRTDSGELDVFEAERYFSAETLPQKTRQLGSWRQGRASLDMPVSGMSTRQETLSSEATKVDVKKKHKQPSSPGGKLASFFNSLISQTVSKKKKSSSKSAAGDDQDSPGGWRRRRRSSISHFSSSTTRSTTKSVQSCSSLASSGFRTPPPYLINLPMKPPSENLYPAASKIINQGVGKEIRDFKRFMEEEDGADSDSSSDLFELQLNHQHHKLGYCGSDLPVYETTRMDAIKISSGTPITNGPFRN